MRTDIEGFVKSVYLGDRACMGIYVNTWKPSLAIHVNLISRIKSGSTVWDFYDGGDIENGHIVFDGLQTFSFSPVGLIPNDFINDFEVEKLNADSYLFSLSISSVDTKGNSTVVILQIVASDCYLINPDNEDEIIR